MTNTKMKPREKLPVENWPQIFDRMNRLGLGIRQRLRTISCFWYFLIFFCVLEPVSQGVNIMFQEILSKRLHLKKSASLTEGYNHAKVISLAMTFFYLRLWEVQKHIFKPFGNLKACSWPLQLT